MTAVNEVVSSLLAGGLLVAGWLMAVRVVSYIRNRRLHRRRANKRFMAAYRAGYRAASSARGGRKR